MKGLNTILIVIFLVLIALLAFFITGYVKGMPLTSIIYGGCGHESQVCCESEFAPYGLCLDPNTVCIDGVCLKPPPINFTLDKSILIWKHDNYKEFIESYPLNNFYMTTQGVGKGISDTRSYKENCWAPEDNPSSGCNNCYLISNINGSSSQNPIKDCYLCSDCDPNEKTCGYCLNCTSYEDSGSLNYDGYASYTNLTNCENCSGCENIDTYTETSEKCAKCTLCESGDVVTKDYWEGEGSKCKFCAGVIGDYASTCYFCHYTKRDGTGIVPFANNYVCDECHKSSSVKCLDDTSYILCDDFKDMVATNLSYPVPIVEDIPYQKAVIMSEAHDGLADVVDSLFHSGDGKCKGDVYEDVSFGFRKNLGPLTGFTRIRYVDDSLSNFASHKEMALLEKGSNYWACGASEFPDSLIYRRLVGGDYWEIKNASEFFDNYSSSIVNYSYSIFYYAPNNVMTICRQPAITTHEDDAILDIPESIVKKFDPSSNKFVDKLIPISQGDPNTTYVRTNFDLIPIKLNYDTRKVDLFNAIVTGFNMWRVVYNDPYYMDTTYNKILKPYVGEINCSINANCTDIDLSGEFSIKKYGAGSLLWSSIGYNPSQIGSLGVRWHIPPGELDSCECKNCRDNMGDYLCVGDANLLYDQIRYKVFREEMPMYRYIIYDASDIKTINNVEYYEKGSTIYIKVDFIAVWKRVEDYNGIKNFTALEFIPIVGVSKNPDLLKNVKIVYAEYRDQDNKEYLDAFNFAPLDSNPGFLKCGQYEKEKKAKGICSCAAGSSNLIGCEYESYSQSDETYHVQYLAYNETCDVQCDMPQNCPGSEENKYYLVAVYCGG